MPTKGRHRWPLTIKFLQQDDVPFRIVVERAEVSAYSELVEPSQILVLDKSGGGLLYARNWIRDVAEQEGHARHWQLDDNIRRCYRLWRGQRIPCDSGPALRVCEDFTDRYENIGISGLNYKMFGLPDLPPFFVNTHVYSCTLVNHAMPCCWRLRYNEDTDLCLQALADDWCTVLLNVFLADKVATMTIRGGNTDDLYQGNGRLIMARTLERMWPGIVTVERRFQRPQHVIDWRRFKQPLKLKEDINLEDLPEADEYGLALTAVTTPKSERIRRLLDDYTLLPPEVHQPAG